MTQRSSRVRSNASSSLSTTRQTTPPPNSRVNFMSTAAVRKNLSKTKLGVYIGAPGLPATALFHLGGTKGDFLIPRHSHDELILRGVFQISRADCFLAPDGVFQPNNAFNSKFEDVKLSCKLTCPHHDDFKFVTDDFDTVLKNIKGFEALFEKTDNDTVNSSVQTSGGWGTIKMVHPLFLRKDARATNPEDLPDATQETEGNQNTTEIDDLGDDFKISTWPVNARCQNLLQEIISKDSHDINPLPAYDIEHNPLPPSKYLEKLPGATVLVSMAFAHHHVKSSKRHFFNGVCRQIIILREAGDLPTSPYKKRRFSRKPLLDSDEEIDSNTAASSSSQGK